MKKNPKVLIIENSNQETKKVVDIINQNNLFTPLIAANDFEAFKILRQQRLGLGFIGYDIDCIILNHNAKTEASSHELKFLTALRHEESLNFLYYRIPIIIINNSTGKLSKSVVSDLSAIKLIASFTKEDLINLLKRIIFDHDAEILLEILTDKS
ncbi:MAG: hypothetical protein WC860_08565 [Candidatus Margulisiibacteriota bacterium]|jgi:hypothetical protein